MNPKAETARIKHKYRRLILTGKLRLPVKPAARLIGPDCAFHLYRTLPTLTEDAHPKPPRRS